MALTKIEWTATTLSDGTVLPGFTFNPWVGCSKVSSGCLHCYAERDFDTRRHFAQWGPNGTRRITSGANWKQPRKWNAAAHARLQQFAATRSDDPRPPKVFCASLCDVFEDFRGIVMGTGGLHGYTLDNVRVSLWELIDDCCDLTWLLLTKRPENISRMIPEHWIIANGFPAHVWLGTSVEDQEAADARIPHLLECPAAVRFLSVEPLLGEINLYPGSRRKPDWVIVGGESGPGARPCNVHWIRSIVQQCREAGTPVFVKQLGAHPYEENGLVSPWPPATKFTVGAGLTCHFNLRDRKGGDPAEWPEDLRVREFPRI